MATLTNTEKVKIRKAIARKAAESDVPVAWVKGAINDAAQVVEDILASGAFQTQVSNAIDTASAPYSVTFTNAEKKWIGAVVMDLKYVRDIV